jgi:DNA-binding transcriptional regulator YiaG
MEDQSAGGAAARRPARPRRARYDAWDAQRVKALRRHLGYTQQQLSDELGTRQQTVSEWETGMYQPRGASARLLSLIAERAAFRYEESEPGSAAGVAAPAPGAPTGPVGQGSPTGGVTGAPGPEGGAGGVPHDQQR